VLRFESKMSPAGSCVKDSIGTYEYNKKRKRKE
jgi:hypothetical protein